MRESGAQLLVRLDAVLERNDHRVRPDRGGKVVENPRKLLCLHANQDKIGGAGRGRGIGRRHRGTVIDPSSRELIVSPRARSACSWMPAGDEVHVFAGASKQPPKKPPTAPAP